MHLGKGEAVNRSSGPIEVYEPSVALTGNQSNVEDGEHGRLSRLVHLVSLIVNILLFGSKLWVYMQSQSMVVLASLVDSTVDLLAQGILLLTNRLATLSRDPSEVILYPAGRSRAEPVGVIACALLMAMASAQVIRDSSVVLAEWWSTGAVRYVDLDITDQLVLGMTTLLKFVLYLWCVRQAKALNNVTVEAVAQDHMNDVLSNTAALAAAVATQLTAALWFADPGGAVLISIYIIYSWARTGMEQLDLVIGRSADPDFLELVREMAETHDPGATLDQIRAYHFGPRFLVEVEIVMLPETPLRESHDVGIVLQHKIERLEQVERCFVHVDYQERDVDDHDPLTPLVYKTQDAARLPPPRDHPKSPRDHGSSSGHADFSQAAPSAVQDAPPPVAPPVAAVSSDVLQCVVA